MRDKFDLVDIGFCPLAKFDEVEARRMVNDGFDRVRAQHSDKEIKIVSGLANVGVLGITYQEVQKTAGKLLVLHARKQRTPNLSCRREKKRQ